MTQIDDTAIRSRATGTIPVFDGLRALACLTVFLENLHIEMRMRVSGGIGPFGLPHLAESGIGVALLIVLSGALLSRPFWQALDTGGRIDLLQYAKRRLLRIAPPYYACLLFLAVVSSERPSAQDLLSHVLFVNNLWEDSFYGISPQFWTIGVFMQLYVALPLTFALVGAVSRRRQRATLLMGVLAVGTYLLHAFLMTTREHWVVGPVTQFASPDGYVVSHSTLAHLPLFLLGVIAGSALSARTRFHDRGTTGSPDVLFWTSAGALFVMSTSPLVDGWAFPYGRYLFPWMPLVAAVAIAAAPRARSARPVLGDGPLRWLGVISYGVYVYHVTCMQVVRRAATQANVPLGVWSYALVSLLVTLIVATASYLLLERPLMRRWSKENA